MKNKQELIKELRAITSAGISDCLKALEESSFDLQKAVDIVKVKGLNIISGREGKVASEGVAVTVREEKTNAAAMMEINCQTDFVARSPDFTQFVINSAAKLLNKTLNGEVFSASDLDDEKSKVVAITKENIVIRRWWVEQGAPSTKVFHYMHSNNKIGVLLTLFVDNKNLLLDSKFNELGSDLTMQVAAMAPLAISPDRLDLDVVSRQRKIFETQLKELNKPMATWEKIIEGKTKKWHTEVCLLQQESIIVPKSSVQEVIAKVSAELGCEIKVINFIRCQVGEGIEKKQENLAEEVSKLI